MRSSAPAIGTCTCIWPLFLKLSKTASPIKANSHVKPPWERGTKVCIIVPGHMTKMAARSINAILYGKNLLENQKSDDLEPWH